MNRVNKWVSKRFGFYFVYPTKNDMITFLSGVVLGLLIYGLILVHIDIS